ncbi:hypothetical protein BKA82DRAFT_155949, partial [Pisolithus tinctorius]
KEFPWWGELHGWWCMNPAYNSTWSAADTVAQKTVCMFVCFTLVMTKCNNP